MSREQHVMRCTCHKHMKELCDDAMCKMNGKRVKHAAQERHSAMHMSQVHNACMHGMDYERNLVLSESAARRV